MIWAIHSPPEVGDGRSWRPLNGRRCSLGQEKLFSRVGEQRHLDARSASPLRRIVLGAKLDRRDCFWGWVRPFGIRFALARLVRLDFCHCAKRRDMR